MGKLVIDGNSIYEIDEECIKKKEENLEVKSGKEPERKQENEMHRKH